MFMTLACFVYYDFALSFGFVACLDCRLVFGFTFCLHGYELDYFLNCFNKLRKWIPTLVLTHCHYRILSLLQIQWMFHSYRRRLITMPKSYRLYRIMLQAANRQLNQQLQAQPTSGCNTTSRYHEILWLT